MCEKKIKLVHLQITKKCNLRCWFCGQWGKKGFFSDSNGSPLEFSEWKTVVDDIYCYGKKIGKLPTVILWGGEPLTCNFFDEISHYLKDMGFHIGVVTNGTLIDKHIESINSCIEKLYVSIDGPEKVHDAIRGYGVYEKVLNNLKLLNNKKIIVMSVVTKKLLDNLENFLEELAPIGISELYLQDMIGLSHDEVEIYKTWIYKTFGITANDISTWENDNLEIFDTKNIVDSLNDYGYKITCFQHDKTENGTCLSPYHHINIAWNGNVLYCTDFYDFYAGNIRNDTITDILENEKSEKFRREIENGRCVTCNHCSWRNNDSFN